MGWFRKETKEADETKETKDTTEEKDNEFVSEFDRNYKVDKDGNYMYRDTPDDPTKGKTAEKKTDNTDDDEMDPDMNRNKGREIDDDDER